MSASTDIKIWDTAATTVLPANLTAPAEITEFAKQLSSRERKQVVAAYGAGHYELATSFVWGRAMASLKRELSGLGTTFLAEVLGRTDIRHGDDINDAISEKEAIRLAEELGVIARTDAIRLRNSQELVSHFSQRESTEEDEPMELHDAIGVLLSCVKSVLVNEGIAVAMQFAEFREKLESNVLEAQSEEVVKLMNAAYFYRRLALSVLLSGIRTHTGAKLENCISNLQVILPLLWPSLREAERWQVGTSYAHLYTEGLQKQTAGLREGLLKVKGFDYVPETLRSQMFLRAAEAVVKAHESMNNFYNEETPMANLEKLGTVIPAPAVGPCVSACLAVHLGNTYGYSWAANAIAEKLLKKQTADRWTYYLDKVLPGDIRILSKLGSRQPRERFIVLVNDIVPGDVSVSGKDLKRLLKAARAKKSVLVDTIASEMIKSYYKS